MTNRGHAHSWSIEARLLPVVAVALVLSGCVQYTTAPAVPRVPSTPTPLPSPLPPASGASVPQAGGWLLLSMEEFGNAHLFIFDIASARFSRITWGDWNDIEPSISPDGSSVAFASDRAGAWDLYTLNLASGSVTQLTNSPEYDGSPVWSPDMAWMAYDTLNDGQLDIAIQSLTDRSAAPVLLTDDPASDHSPSWSPDGRKIAFVSNRLGNEDIWLADLDKASDRFSNITQSPRTAENHPAWSRDGSHVAWAAAVQNPGYPGIYIWDASRPDAPASWVGTGTWPVWSPDGSRITTVIDAPTNQLLGAFDLRGTPVSLPTSLSGRVRGLIWPAVSLPDPLPAPYLDAAQQVAPAASVATSTPLPDVPSQRWHIVPLEDVQAPSAGLHALAEPSFRELRARLIAEAGWDPLASLENTFVPITTTLDPGLDQDWLYTGRAFVINTLMLNAGWMSVQREDIGDQTYWRVFIRAHDQDGSHGAPIKDPPWDLNTRYQLDPQAYEAGGSYAPVPSGYWIDLTSLAEAYGWHRLAALPGWRTYYTGARFSEFAYTEGLDWYSAMLQLYPADALITATPLLPPTRTPTRTPRPTDTPYPTLTPRDTRTPTVTFTPSVSPTPLPPSQTPAPTSTPPTVIPTFPSPTP